MKSKFTQLVKVRKREVDKVESELVSLQNRKRDIENKIKDILVQISELKTPQSGDFAKLNLSFSYLLNLSNQKKLKEEELLYISEQIDITKELYKKANIEYEKIKYLEEQEIQKMLDELKREESKAMDEIATLLQNRKKIEA